MMELRFDPDTHSYWYDDLWVPGLTRVLRSAGMMGQMGGSQAAMDRGTWVHSTLPLLESGRLQLGELRDAEHRGYCESWLRLRELWADLQIVEWERLVGDPALWVATQVDAVCKDSIGTGVIDFKTGPAHAWHGLQTAGEQHLVGADWRVVIYLYADGSPASMEHQTAPGDLTAFRGCCQAFRWKIEHGLESAPYVGQELPQ